MKSENKSDRHLVVGSLEVLQEITGGAIRTIQTEIKDTAQTAKTLGADFKDFFTQMTFDNFISPAEKKILKKEHDQIVLDYPLVCAHAIELGIIESDSRFIAYKTAYENLYTYLYTTIQVFDEMEKETTLAHRSDFDDIWNAYYAALTTIQINVNNEIINGYSSGTQVEAPDNLTLSSAIAEQHKIVVTANLLNQGLKNSLKKVIFYIQKTVGGVWEEYENESYVFEYFFDRATDGYPEAGTYAAKDLGNWTIRAKAVNIYGKVSADYGNEILVNTDNYGTWNVLPPDVISAQSANRAANVTWQRKDKTPLGKDIYGISFYDIQISMNATVWFKPAQGKTGKVSESDWQDGEGQVRLSGGGWSQSLPLHNQTINLPENTTYYYRVRTRGITDDYLSVWSDPVTAIALATGIGDIIENAIKHEQLAPNAVSYDNLNVLARNLVNPLIGETERVLSVEDQPDGWAGLSEIIQDADFKAARIIVPLEGVTVHTSEFEVLPTDVLEVTFMYKTTFIGGSVTVKCNSGDHAVSSWNNTTKAWNTPIVGEPDLLSEGILAADYTSIKIYISGVAALSIPAPSVSAVDNVSKIHFVRLNTGETTCSLSFIAGGLITTAGDLYIKIPTAIKLGDGKIIANQIHCSTLSSISADVGELESGLIRSVIKTGESKPNVLINLDTEEFRIGNNPSLEAANSEDAEYIHWIPGESLRIKPKNFTLDAVASTIRGVLRVKGLSAAVSASVFIINPENSVDAATNTPANTTQIKQSVIANNVKLVTPLTGWLFGWNVLLHLESSGHGAIAWLNTADGKGWLIGMENDGRFIISRLTSKTTGYYLLTITDTKEIFLDSKKAIGFADAFLRLNDSNAFTYGIWLGSSALGGNGEIGLGSTGLPSTARIRMIPGTYNGANAIVINGATGNISALGGFSGHATSSGRVNGTNFDLYEDANYVNLHTKNAKPLYLEAANAAAYLYGLVIHLGNSGQKVGILTANTSMYQPDSTYPVSIGGYVHMNNKPVDFACRFHCMNNGNGDIRITTAKGELTGDPNDYYPTIKTSHSYLYFDIASTYAFALGSDNGTTILQTGTNTKLQSVSPFYGAVGNDICDNFKIASQVKNFEYGYCYCEENGEYKKGNRGIIGITSDTASLHCGSDDGMEAGKDYLPIAIGGFVLAFVDRKYRRGTPLKAKKDGSLTRAYWFTPCWKIVATYQEEPKDETWNKATVNGRVIVRVK